MLVFAYGSLMWNPGFRHVSSMPAMAPGWRRSWCIPSTVHRGTTETPGIVLGLVPGRCCVGMAFEVSAADEADVRRYLEERENAEEGYVEAEIEILILRGRASALCYVADDRHPCVGERPEERLVETLRAASGTSGTNIEYAIRSISSVRSIGIPGGWPCPCPGMSLAAADTICRP